MNRANFGANTNVIQMMLDVLIIVLAYVGTFLILGTSVPLELYLQVAVLEMVFLGIFVLSNMARDLYDITRFNYLDRLFIKISTSFLIATGMTGAMVFFFVDDRFVRQYYLAFLGCAYILVFAKIFLINPVNRWSRKKNAPRTLCVGHPEEYPKFFAFWEKTSVRMDFVGYIARNKEEYEKDKEVYLGIIQDVEELVKQHNIDQIYIMQKDGSEVNSIQQYLDICIAMGVTMHLVMDLYEKSSAYSHVSAVGTYPIITYHTVTLNAGEQIAKRILDLLGGFVGLVLSLPIMLVATVLIKLDSPGPAIYKQTRIGKNGRRFEMYKFRSMYVDSDLGKEELMAQNEMTGGVMFKMKDDPRVTPVGRWIRRLSIDELPQFVNVLTGSMSLVGTRPPTLDEVEKYNCNHWRRISIKPGMTGLWQVSGRSNITDFEEIVEKDIEYIDNWSLLGDLKIICKTFVVLAKHNDAY